MTGEQLLNAGKERLNSGEVTKGKIFRQDVTVEFRAHPGICQNGLDLGTE
jgi:hypothetical protein